jgi:hypothetical protein
MRATSFFDDTPELPSIAQEFAQAELGNRSRTHRLCELAQTLSRAPDRSFPKAVSSEAELTALYRFLGNPAYDYLDIIEPHILASSQRVVEAGTVLVIHDTTELEFSGETPRQGLGRLRGEDQGFLAHFSLAVSALGPPRPLGVVGMRTWARTGPKKSKKDRMRARAQRAKDPNNKESQRWAEGIDEVAARIGDQAQLIHLADREGDSYPLLASLIEQNRRFIIRLCHDRAVGAEVVVGTQDHVSDVLRGVAAIVEREVPLSRRAASPIPGIRRTHPAREGRMARLSMRATRLLLKRPGRLGATYPQWLTVHVVHVEEVDPPADVEPVQWTLVTTEPIDTAAQLLQIVDWYRTRWLIEEFNKALKTGCGIEKRQLEDYHGLTNALAVFVPIAWRLLLLRHLARTCPGAPATQVLTPIQIQVLRTFSVRVAVGEEPTVRQVLWAVAGLGGHLKRNGEPGWLTIGRGYEELLTLELGWAAALDEAAAAEKIVEI